jgi:hypothetical protein
MAIFFFDTFDGETLIKDLDGMSCSSTKELQDSAVAALPDMAREKLPDGLQRNFWVRVRDANNQQVFEASMTLSAQWSDEAVSEALFQD